VASDRSRDFHVVKRASSGQAKSVRDTRRLLSRATTRASGGKNDWLANHFLATICGGLRCPESRSAATLLEGAQGRPYRHAPCSAFARPMHYLPFLFKRAHHATLKLLHPIAARSGLTPARFDLLYVLHAKTGMVPPYQFRVAQLLGLSRSTICKMIKAMEKIGLVQRSPEIVFDRRCRRVKITAYGRRCIRQVLKVMRRREIENPLLVSVSFWNCKTRKQRLDYLRGLGNGVGRVLLGLGDWALFRMYPIR
jgi:DNA-binding MarR family transcriptional regulator